MKRATGAVALWFRPLATLPPIGHRQKCPPCFGLACNTNCGKRKAGEGTDASHPQSIGDMNKEVLFTVEQCLEATLKSVIRYLKKIEGLRSSILKRGMQGGFALRPLTLVGF